MGNNVCLFVKPFKMTDDKRGNPLSMEVITDLYRIGCTVNQVKVVNLTPKMIIKHYDEFIKEKELYINLLNSIRVTRLL